MHSVIQTVAAFLEIENLLMRRRLHLLDRPCNVCRERAQYLQYICSTPQMQATRLKLIVFLHFSQHFKIRTSDWVVYLVPLAQQ
jgi:hypothetical protein